MNKYQICVVCSLRVMEIKLEQTEEGFFCPDCLEDVFAYGKEHEALVHVGRHGYLFKNMTSFRKAVKYVYDRYYNVDLARREFYPKVDRKFERVRFSKEAFRRMRENAVILSKACRPSICM